MKVYLGFDSREPKSYGVACRSLLKHASIPVTITPLSEQRLAESGLLRRATDTRSQRYDIPSNAPASTEFAISRFLTPILAQSGWAVFADSDVIFMDDVAEFIYAADPKYAVQVVKHKPVSDPPKKMDGQTNLIYARKNWSSVMLFNCEHPANKRLSLADVQERTGRYLHSFGWLADSEIGELEPRFNWLVGLEPRPEKPVVAHLTLGTPELGVTSELDQTWHEYAA